ncbi:hypothetical protein GCM10029964_083250 [Kibdelosporangium lantanae]
MTGVTENYLRSAEQAGLVAEVAGHQYVAGEYTDPVTGTRTCLVEYCDSAGVRGEALWHHVLERFPTVEAVFLRTPPARPLSPPWRVHSTYLRWHGAGPPLPESSVTLRDAGPDDRAAIVDWLVRALVDGAAHNGRPAVTADARAVAMNVLHAPGTRSFVACRDHAVIGHATVLSDSYDDLTGTAFVELLDVFVDPDPDAREVRHALAAMGMRHARGLGRPLIGHVVHKASSANTEAPRIVESLEAQGWCQDHIYWIRPVDHDGRTNDTRP